MAMFQLIDKNSGYLFMSSELSAIMDQARASVRSEINSMDANQLLNTAPTDLIEYFVHKFRIEPPVLHLEAMTATAREAQVDVRNDPRRWVTDRSRPCLVPGQRIEVDVPFEGDTDLLYARPSSFNLSPPRAEVRGQALHFTFDIPDGSPDVPVKSAVEAMVKDIDGWLGTSRRDLEPFEGSLRNIATKCINDRRERLLANEHRAASLGIPLKSRPDAPRTYALPDVRRKVTPNPPRMSSVPYKPEPVLDVANYDHILSVVQNMAHVMERSPSAFRSMGEEDLRQHFLVQLNGQFEGAATGETFNVSGKTDILLRANDRNVFIAECKFWKGPKQYRQTIDQLLGYKAWRDTKTAIFIFDRGVALSKVLTEIQSQTKEHPNFKRVENWKNETGFRYTFHHTGDTSREFLLTVLVFEVPGPDEPA